MIVGSGYDVSAASAPAIAFRVVHARRLLSPQPAAGPVAEAQQVRDQPQVWLIWPSKLGDVLQHDCSIHPETSIS